MKIKIGLGVFLILFIAIHSTSFAFGFGRALEQPPSPDLVRPYGEKVDLTGKDSLEFKWEIDDLMGISYCEFRLYKGYNMYEGNLVYKEQVQAPNHVVNVKAGLFIDGQSYTWYVYEVNLAGIKSDKAFSSFEVIKK